MGKELYRNAIKIGAAVGFVGAAIGGGAHIENKLIQEALANNDRTPICHSGNGKNWTLIAPNEASYPAHLKDWQGKAKGHDNDYFAFDRNNDGTIDELDCPPTPATITPVPSLTPELTATFFPSPTVVYSPTPENSPTSTQIKTEVASPTPKKTEIIPTVASPTSTVTQEAVCPTLPTEVCNLCEEVERSANAQETSAAALEQKVGPEQTMAAAAATDASAHSTEVYIESENYNRQMQENLASLSTPTLNVVTANQLSINNLSQNSEDNGLNEVALAFGAAGLVAGAIGGHLYYKYKRATEDEAKKK